MLACSKQNSNSNTNQQHQQQQQQQQQQQHTTPHIKSNFTQKNNTMDNRSKRKRTQTEKATANTKQQSKQKRGKKGSSTTDGSVIVEKVAAAGSAVESESGSDVTAVRTFVNYQKINTGLTC